MSITERYATAVGASTLEMDYDHAKPVDTVIASGWTHSRMGAVLRRLQVEWDSTGKPLKMTNKARRRTLQALRSWSQAVRMMGEWCDAKGIPEHVGLAALAYFVDDTCPKCYGRGFQVIPGTPSLSATPCNHCRGSGRMRPPDECARALRMFSGCVGADIVQMRGSLGD